MLEVRWEDNHILFRRALILSFFFFHGWIKIIRAFLPQFLCICPSVSRTSTLSTLALASLFLLLAVFIPRATSEVSFSDSSRSQQRQSTFWDPCEWKQNEVLIEFRVSYLQKGGNDRIKVMVYIGVSVH